MARKKMNFYGVSTTDGVDFGKVLLSKKILRGTSLREGKEIEVKFVEEKDGGEIIIGFIISTKREGIPPKHVPLSGNFDSINLDTNEGLAYANIFLFNRKLSILGIEVNRAGASPAQFKDFLLEKVSGRGKWPRFQAAFTPLLDLESYRTLMSFNQIRELDISIASPTGLLKAKRKGGSGEDIVNLATNLNGKKEIRLISKAETGAGAAGMNRNAIEEMINQVEEMKGRLKWAKVRGRKTLPSGEEKIDVIDLVGNRMFGFLNYKINPIEKDINKEGRTHAALSLWREKYSEIHRIVSHD